MKFGDQIAEIISRNNDSLVVKVPGLPVGKFDINVKTLLKTYTYPQIFEIMAIDFSLFKNFAFNMNGLDLKINSHSYFWSVIDKGSSDFVHIWNGYSKKITNSFPLVYEKIGNNTNSLSEINSLKTNYIKNVINLNVENNNKIKTMILSFYNSSEDYKTDSQSYSTFSLSFKLINVEINSNSNDSNIIITLYKNDIVNKMTDFKIRRYDRYEKFRNHRRIDEHTITLLEFLGINDDATIEIKFTK